MLETVGEHIFSSSQHDRLLIPCARRVNPVEDIYAAFPFFLYINPTYAGQLLSPLLEFQDSVQYNQPYAARDLGDYRYPFAPTSPMI